MKLAIAFGMGGAVLVHAAFLAFGGLLIPEAAENAGTTQEVELLSEVEAEQPKPEPELAEPEPEPHDPEEEPPPDPVELARSPDVAPTDDAPALDAASLSALEAALNGGGAAGGDFGDALSLASGGRLGGTGKVLDSDDALENAFNPGDIDQEPRAMFQPPPMYPAELRKKKLEGVVTLIFVVDESGKVTKPKVENSTHDAFKKPALEALKQWKFEPGLKAGQRVSRSMRIAMRFQPS